MAYYQSTDILKEFQLKGSFKIEYAPYVADYTAAVWVDAGMCDNPSFVENIEFLEGNASNAAKPEINTGVGKQLLAIAFDPWAYDITNDMFLRGGIDTLVTSADAAAAGLTEVYTGGLTEITPFMIKFTNSRIDKVTAADLIQYTGTDYTGLSEGDPIYRDVSLIGFKCSPTAGTNVTGKNDDDTDAAMRFPKTFEGLEDTTRDSGKQLSVTVRNIVPIV
jgi:hypothetical protein